MKESKNRGYGTVTLVSTVVGTVIGSGIFFKSEEILKITNGNALLGLLAFAVCGGVMLICASTFAVLSAETEAEGGAVGYAEKVCGLGYARFVAIFSADFYLPSMTATLASVSSLYFCELWGFGDNAVLHAAVAGLFLIAAFGANTLTPRGAARFQVASTAVKLLPLLAVGIVGSLTFAGGSSVGTTATGSGGFMPALLSAAFAYEGWIAVTALGGSSSEERRKMSRALILGSLTVLFVYVFYYVGVIGTSGDGGAVFERILGANGGSVMQFFVTVSCLGALNGLAMSTVRGHYVLSKYLRRDEREGGLFGEISERTGIPVLSGMAGLLVSELWLIYGIAVRAWQGSAADPSDISVSVMYAVYIPIFLSAAVRFFRVGKRGKCALSLIASAASLLPTVAAPVSFGLSTVFYLVPMALWCVAILTAYRR